MPIKADYILKSQMKELRARYLAEFLVNVPRSYHSFRSDVVTVTRLASAKYFLVLHVEEMFSGKYNSFPDIIAGEMQMLH
jgi:hypothetical protein